MKKILLPFITGVLCTWFSVHSASTSAEIISEEYAEPATDEFTIAYFLHAANVRPKTVTLSSYGYMRDANTSIDTACAKLSHLEKECKPLITKLFTHQPEDKRDLESLLHLYIVGRYAIAQLFNQSRDSNISSSFSSVASPRPLKTLVEILNAMTRESVRTDVYWDLLDERPNTSAAGYPFTQSQQQKPQPRQTISTLRTWFSSFKLAQQDGKTPASLEALDEAYHSLFEERRRQMRIDRERIMAETMPGVLALENLQAQFSTQVHENADRSHSSCAQQ